MRCSTCRLPGSATQPVSWPCVAPTRWRAPAARSRGRAARAAPRPRRRRVSQPYLPSEVDRGAGRRPRRQQHARRRPDHRVGQRGVVLGRPRRVEASTTTESGGRRSSSAATKVWMPPCRGGKSLVTTSVRLIRGPAAPSRGRTRPAAPSSGASRRTTARAAGGSGSARPLTASRRCMATKACRVAGQVQRVDVGPGLDLPGDGVLQRAWTSRVPAATRNSSSGTTRGSPGAAGARPREQPGGGQQPAEQGHPRGGAQRADQVPVRTSSAAT